MYCIWSGSGGKKPGKKRNMLELIHDNRSGDKLEIVLPALNEEARAVRLVRHYSPWFDVVVLDDGSSDATVDKVIAAGGTVFRRTVKNIVAEAHFAYYADFATRSGRCFWMFADEFVPRVRMIQIDSVLTGGTRGVKCRRVNYFFAREVKTLTSIHPRGFRQGAAQFTADNLHGSLELTPEAADKAAPEVFEVHHFHVGSTRGYFGTAGAYAFAEVDEFLRKPHPHRRFLRRYAGSLGAFVVLKWWRETSLSGPARLSIAVERLVILLLASLSWLEQKHLPTAAQQQAAYDVFFAEDTVPVELTAAQKAHA